MKKTLATTLCILSLSSVTFAQTQSENITEQNILIDKNVSEEFDATGTRVDEYLQNALIRKTYCRNDFQNCIIKTKKDGSFEIFNMEDDFTVTIQKGSIEEISVDYNYVKNAPSTKAVTMEEIIQPEIITDTKQEITVQRMVVENMVNKAIEINESKYPNLSKQWNRMSLEEKEKVARSYIATAGLTLKPQYLEKAREDFIHFNNDDINNLPERLVLLINKYRNQ